MSIWSLLNNLISKKQRAKNLINESNNIYWQVRKEFHGKDEHFYLIKTHYELFERIGYLKQNNVPLIVLKNDLAKLCFRQTYVQSVLESPHSIRALSLYIVCKSIPSEEVTYIDEYSTLMNDILGLDKDSLLELYKKKNPSIANFFEIVSGEEPFLIEDIEKL